MKTRGTLEVKTPSQVSVSQKYLLMAVAEANRNVELQCFCLRVNALVQRHALLDCVLGLPVQVPGLSAGSGDSLLLVPQGAVRG